MTRHYHNSFVVRAFHNYPTAGWFDHLSDLYLHFAGSIQGEIDSIPGPNSGEVDWFFEHEEDAMWFMLKYGGRILTESELPLKLNLKNE